MRQNVTPIRTSIANWFMPPVFADQSATKDAQILSMVVWTSLLAVAIFMIAAMVAQPGITLDAVTVLTIFGVMTILTLEISRRGYTKQASWLFVVFCILLITQRSFAAGGIRSPGVGMYFVFALMAGLLLGERAGILVAGICSAIGLGLVVAERAGVIHPGTFRYTATVYWLLNCLYMAIVIALLHLATQSLRLAGEYTARELAERKRAERRLAVALEAGEIGIWDMEVLAGDLHADRRCFEIFGLSPASSGVISRTAWMKMIHPDDQHVMRSAIGDLIAGLPHAKVQFRIIRPNGAIRHVRLTAVPIESQRTTHVGTIVDITERNEAAEERDLLTRGLRQRVQGLNVLHRAAELLRDRPLDPGLLAEFSALITQAWMYPECCEVHIQYGDIQGATPGWKKTRWQQVAEFTTSCGRGAITVSYTEERPIAFDGPFYEEEKNLLNSLVELMVGYLERDHAEQRRLRAELQLREAQKMEAMGSLAGGIAHDFNNVLAAIQGFSGLLQDDLPASSQQHRFAERISLACEHGKDIVAQILAFARHGTQQRQVTSISALLQKSAELLAGSLPETIQLSVFVAEPDIAISANRGQIRQVVLNLCNNAWESIGKRNGVIHIAAGKLAQTDLKLLSLLQPSATNHFSGKLDLTLEYAFIRVSDNGPGIPPDALKRIFDPFFTTKGRRRGTGLGLSVVHSVVESHGGFVAVETMQDQGTTFSVLLPALREAPTIRENETHGQLTNGGERILIVDDKFDVADSLAIGFERLGYDVLALTDPRDALQALNEDPASWQVLITDHVMPEMNGTDLIAKAKTLAPDIIAALCTGCTSEETQHCLEIDLQFHKPVSPSDIARDVRKILDQRSSPVRPNDRVRTERLVMETPRSKARVLRGL